MAAASLIIPAFRRHTSTVIVAHGLADSGDGWRFLASNWRQEGKFLETKFVFPNAPSIPITVNEGMTMPGWYDIRSFEELEEDEDEIGIKRSQAHFHQLVAQEVESGVPSDRIVLGGFSQGGAMSLMAGITNPTKLGGIFGLSSYLLLQGKLKDMVPEENPNKETPIFMGHGDSDEVVRYIWGQKTAARLKEWGWDVDFKTYPGLHHFADPDEIDDLEAYLRQRIPDQGDQVPQL